VKVKTGTTLPSIIYNNYIFYYSYFAKFNLPDTNELAPIWLHDNMSTNCMMCRKTFTVVKRRVYLFYLFISLFSLALLLINQKHHCRKCGRLVCASCSQKKVMLTNLGKAKRVCDECAVSKDIGNRR
jgi:hypothetical protein